MLVCLFFYSAFLSFFISPGSFLDPLDSFNNWITKLLPRAACRRQAGISQSHCQTAEQLQHLWPVSWPESRSVPQPFQLCLVQEKPGHAVPPSEAAGQWPGELRVLGGVQWPWKQFRTSKGAWGCRGLGRTVRCHPVKNRLSRHCSQIAPSQKVVKHCSC